MIHSALITLIRLQARGTARRLVRGVKSIRGAVFFALGLLMLVLWLGPSIFSALSMPRSPSESIDQIIPFVLLGFSLLSFRASAAGAGIYFTPSEVDFLFSGPFTRRELLGFKLLKAAASALLVSLCFSVGILRYVSWWIAAYTGCFLAFQFMTLLSMSLAIVAQTVEEQLYNRARKIVLLGVVLLAGLWMGRWLLEAQPGGFTARLGQFRESLLGCIVLAPFEVFSHAITARSLVPGLLVWTLAGAAINATLTAAVMLLDANYMEVSLTTSQRVHQRLQKLRSGGTLTAWNVTSTSRLRLPMLPRMGGAGAIAWRQITSALRTSPGFLMLLAILGGVGGVALRTMGPPERIVALIPVLIAWMTFFFSILLRYDFRSELDHLEWIKALPLSAAAVAIGELITPTVLMSAVQFAVLGGLAMLVETVRWPALVALPFIPLLNGLLFGLENLFFLLFPARNIQPSPGDLQAMGRQMVVMFAKLIVLAACCGMAIGCGFLAYWLAARSWVALGLVSWIILAAHCLAIVPCIAWAYRRFDVSTDLPG